MSVYTKMFLKNNLDGLLSNLSLFIYSDSISSRGCLPFQLWWLVLVLMNKWVMWANVYMNVCVCVYVQLQICCVYKLTYACKYMGNILGQKAFIILKIAEMFIFNGTADLFLPMINIGLLFYTILWTVYIYITHMQIKMHKFSYMYTYINTLFKKVIYWRKSFVANPARSLANVISFFINSF